MMLIGALGFGSVGLTLASLPLWSLSRGVQREYVGLITTAMFAATVAGQLLVPRLMGLLRPGRSLAVGMLGLGAPSLLYPLASGFLPIAALSAVRGLGFAILTVVGLSIVADLSVEGRRGATLSLYGLAGAIPNLFTTAVGVLLTQTGHFTWLCIAAGAPLVAVPAAVKIDRALTSTAPRVRARAASSTVFEAARAVLPAAGMLLLVATTIGGVTTYLPIAHPGGIIAAAALFTMSATAVVAKWRSGPLSDRVRGWLLAATALFASGAGLAALWLGLEARLDLVLLAGIALFGAGYGALTNVTLVVSLRRSGIGQVVVAIAVWNIALDVGQAVGAPATGLLASTGLESSGAFGVNAAVLGLAAGLTWLVFFRRERRTRR